MVHCVLAIKYTGLGGQTGGPGQLGRCAIVRIYFYGCYCWTLLRYDNYSTNNSGYGMAKKGKKPSSFPTYVVLTGLLPCRCDVRSDGAFVHKPEASIA
jgi:hypothetical protein